MSVVVLVPKLGKNPEECSSYRPISLNNDAKILANHLSKVLADIINVDQTGLMPGKDTDN